MDPISLKKGESIVTNISRRKDDLRIVVTDASTDIALALIYRILTDDTFGTSQSVFVSLFEFRDKAVFLESVVIELTSFSPNLLNGEHPRTFAPLGPPACTLSLGITRYHEWGITYSWDASVAFKDADVVFCIGSAREYAFNEEEYTDPFFKEYARIAKFYGESIEKYVKRDARVIVLGSTAATIISRYVKSIPVENITVLTIFNLKMAAAQIAARAKCLPTEVKNIIIWGNNNRYTFPDCRYVSLPKGRTLSDKMKVWLRNNLPHIMASISNRPSYLRSIAYGLADHCKILWNGTPENEWTCMGVSSDHSYGVRSGIFFSFPVVCRNKRYEIVQGLCNDEYLEKYILNLSRLMGRDVSAAIEACGLISSHDE